MAQTRVTQKAAMEAQIREAIAAGTQPQRYKTSIAQFIRVGGKNVRLIGADSRTTAEGRYYYGQIGISPPLSYRYDQPLINDKWVVGFDGTRIKVRDNNNADGSWKITKAGRKGE